MKQYIIDRFENEIAIIEIAEGNQVSYIEIKKDKLPQKAKEGDVLVKLKEGKFSIDVKETKERSKRIKEKMDSLWE